MKTVAVSKRRAADSSAAGGVLAASSKATGAAGAPSRRALQLRIVTLAHPTVTYVEDFSVGLARINVEVDDELLGAVLHLLSGLRLDALSQSADGLGAALADVRDHLWHRIELAESNVRRAL